MFRKVLWILIPLLSFVLLFLLLAQGLKRDQKQMPSAFLNKSLPDFSLTDLYDENKSYDKEIIEGQLALINVWASWCPPCAKEHEVIIELAQQGIPIFGLNYQDTRENAQAWLQERGDPYQKIFFDPKGDVGIDWGVIGVPETFLLDAKGIVRYRHIGELTPAIWNDQFLPMITKLQGKTANTATSPYVFTHPQDEARFFRLAGQLRCLVCQNQTLLDSDAPLAKSLREQLYTLVLQGESDEVILQYLSDRYGDFIFYQPPLNKKTGLLWFGPIILLLVAAVIVIVVIRRANKQHQDEK